MTLEIKLPDGTTMMDKEIVDFQFFLQMMTNRAFVGSLRYGPINRNKKYLDHLRKEMRYYTTIGNAEQLLNVAVYAFLEWHAPQHKKFHFDNTEKSVTRNEGPTRR